MLLICWLIPIILLIAAMGFYISGNHLDNVVYDLKKQTEYGTQVTMSRLEDAVTATRRASYDGTIKKAWQQYKNSDQNYWKMYKTCENYMMKEYRDNRDFDCTMLWFYENASYENCSVYNLKAKGSFQKVKDYWEKDHEAVMKYTEGLDTAVGFQYIDGRLYMVRNLVDSKFKPFAALIMRINTENCFGSFLNNPAQKALTLFIDDQWMNLSGELLDTEALENTEMFAQTGVLQAGKSLYLRTSDKNRDYRLVVYEKLAIGGPLEPFYGYELVIGGMLLSLLPLIFMASHFYNKSITKPLGELMKGAEEIEKGNLGYRLEKKPDSRELLYLQDSFNEMSVRLKEQFDRIYEEEIALRDARIMALQSHINPHFLNNTLEIINWEARLADDVKVSKMIENLGTLMDAAIDRRRQPQVHLAEEMTYMNAYLYITKERLGKRLEIINEIPENVMDCYVPRLILQPVIENAVEHGVVPSGRGTIWLKGWKEEKYLYLEIINDGKMSEADQAKINRLLAPDYDTSKESAGNMGIANVNQRLKILYGEPCGLTLKMQGDKKVAARLTIALPCEQEEQNSSNSTISDNK